MSFCLFLGLIEARSEPDLRVAAEAARRHGLLLEAHNDEVGLAGNLSRLVSRYPELTRISRPIYYLNPLEYGFSRSFVDYGSSEDSPITLKAHTAMSNALVEIVHCLINGNIAKEVVVFVEFNAEITGEDEAGNYCPSSHIAPVQVILSAERFQKMVEAGLFESRVIYVVMSAPL